MRNIAVLALIAVLSACGQRAALRPVKGAQLPVAPYGSAERKTADQLLKPPVQAVPERSVELRKRSEERADDPFDLPPQE